MKKDKKKERKKERKKKPRRITTERCEKKENYFIFLF